MIQNELSGTLTPSNDQSVFVYPETARALTAREDGSPCIDRGPNIVMAFTQNQRDEVRDLGDKAGALASQPGMKQQTFICGGFNYQAGGVRSIGYQNEKAPTLITCQLPAVLCAGFKAGNGAKAGSIGHSEEVSPTLAAAPSGMNQVPAVLCIQGNVAGGASKQNGEGVQEEVAYTLNTRDVHAVYDARGNGDGETVGTLTGDHEDRVTDYTAIVMATGQGGGEIMVDKFPTLTCNHEAPLAAVDCRNGTENPDINGTLQAKSTGGQSVNYQNVVRSGRTVRRLTPLECERLQGYPDGWTLIGELVDVVEVVEVDEERGIKTIWKCGIYKYTDGSGKMRLTSDAARYKALGNSIAIPPWSWVLKRLCACYERPATMASLFDGIGGFPLIWERLNGPGTCLWASEIEDFPMAVTKARFGEG